MMQIQKILSITLISVLLITVSTFAVNFTLTQTINAAQCTLEDNSFLGIPTWYKYLEGDDSGGVCSPVLGEVDGSDPRSFNVALPIGLAVLEILIRLAGLVAVVMVFVGAFRFITTQGNPEKAASARKTIINAIIGLVIVILATTIVNFIGNSLTS